LRLYVPELKEVKDDKARKRFKAVRALIMAFGPFAYRGSLKQRNETFWPAGIDSPSKMAADPVARMTE